MSTVQSQYCTEIEDPDKLQEENSEGLFIKNKKRKKGLFFACKNFANLQKTKLLILILLQNRKQTTKCFK